MVSEAYDSTANHARHRSTNRCKSSTAINTRRDLTSGPFVDGILTVGSSPEATYSRKVHADTPSIFAAVSTSTQIGAGPISVT